MASSHHHLDCDCRRLHHHSHRESSPHMPSYYNKSSDCFCVDCSPCRTQCSPPNLDQLLRLVASYLQNQQQTQPASVKRQRFVNQENDQREYDNLLRKINDLDLSLDRFSARRESYSSLKDSAARGIQTHFLSYLVRRSASLRQLKELTRIESSFVSLRSSVSGQTHFPFEAVSREATRLLLRLDYIKGGADSMIRDGKRTLCRDLVRFLHYVDGCAVRRRNVENIAELEEFGQDIPIVYIGKSRKLGALKPGVESVKRNKVKTPVYELTLSAEDDDDGEEIMMMSRDDGVGNSSSSRCSSGVVGKTRVTKNVSFNENGNVYKVYGDSPEATGGDDGSTSGSNNESGDGYSEVENIKYVSKENDGFEDEESLSENEEESSSSQGSKEEVQLSGNVSHTGRNKTKREVQLGKGSLMFSPPLPLKMEP
ncbi:hypothetical protein N665_1048s0003 [Sinapis alba]|nr:hypothetical protein N665_1048s0003 [Sinapis alba]